MLNLIIAFDKVKNVFDYLEGAIKYKFNHLNPFSSNPTVETVYYLNSNSPPAIILSIMIIEERKLITQRSLNNDNFKSQNKKIDKNATFFTSNII